MQKTFKRLFYTLFFPFCVTCKEFSWNILWTILAISCRPKSSMAILKRSCPHLRIPKFYHKPDPFSDTQQPSTNSNLLQEQTKLWAFQKSRKKKKRKRNHHQVKLLLLYWLWVCRCGVSTTTTKGDTLLHLDRYFSAVIVLANWLTSIARNHTSTFFTRDALGKTEPIFVTVMLLMWHKTKFVGQTTERSQHRRKHWFLKRKHRLLSRIMFPLSLDDERMRRNTSIEII